MKDPMLVCGRPCAYRLGSILPWPPALPGTDDWARGDHPTICAYLGALGERIFSQEEKIERLEQKLADLGKWGPTGDRI